MPNSQALDAATFEGIDTHDSPLTAPNKAVEPTAPMVALWYAGAVHGAAAHRQRSVARAAGGGWRVGPTSDGVGRRLEGRGTPAGRQWQAGLRRAPWERGRVARAGALPPTEQRTGADGPQWQLLPMRV